MLTTIILLIVFGILAIIAEMVLPAGILGIAGAASLFAAVILVFNEYGPTVGLLASVALGIFGFATFWFWMKYFHRLPFTRRMVHQAEVGNDQTRTELPTMKGKIGQALTDLRPSGRVAINGEKLDVVAESGSIEKGAEVTVVGTSGATLVVRASSGHDG